MADQVTVVTRKNIVQRMGESVVMMLVGIVLFFVCVFFLFRNEGEYVYTNESIMEAESMVQPLGDMQTPAVNRNGELVYVTGFADSPNYVEDPLFFLSVDAIRLRRTPMFYQWKESSSSEKRTTLGGTEETVTTYSYSKTWTSSPVDSGLFQEPSGHENVVFADVPYAVLNATPVEVGAYTLPDFLLDELYIFTDYPLPQNGLDYAGIADYWGMEQADINHQANTLYLGCTPGRPVVGCVSVGFALIKPTDVSFIAALDGTTFKPYKAKNSYSFSILRPGTLTSDELIQAAKEDNSVNTWIMRIIFTVLLIVSLYMLTSPLSTLASIIPFLGTIVSAGGGIMALFLGLAVSLSVIGVAWLFYRPLYGLAIVGVALLFLLVPWFRGRKRQEVRVM